MKAWKLWSAGMFLVVGVACDGGGARQECSEDMGCNKGLVCSNNVCGQKSGPGACEGLDEGEECDGGRGVCRSNICEQKSEPGKCEGLDEGEECDGGRGVCRNNICEQKSGLGKCEELNEGDEIDLNNSQIIEQISPLIPQEYVADAIAYLDTQLKQMGESILAGRQTLSMPFAGYFIFVDLEPMANWGHSAMGIFISQDGTQIENISLRFPPFFGGCPPHYRKLELTAKV